MPNRPEMPGKTSNAGVNVFSSSFTSSTFSNNHEQGLKRPISSPSIRIKSEMRLLESSNTIDEEQRDDFYGQALQSESKDRYTHKLLSSLPYVVRENVISILTSAQNTAARLQRDIEVKNVENLKLRQELSKKIVETEQAQKLVGIYREKIRMADDKIAILNETVESNQKSIVKNRRVMDRLSSTNRTLMESLEAVQLTDQNGSHVNYGSNAHATNAASHSNLQSPSNHPYALPSSPSKRTHKPDFSLNIPSPKKNMVSGIINTGLIGDSSKGLNTAEPKLVQKKLRESLLKVVRVHYQSMKNTDILEAKLEQLKSKLKQSEIELIEHRRRHEAEINGDYVDGSPSRRTTASTINNNTAVTSFHTITSSRKHYRSYGEADDRFQGLLTSNHIDMSDTVIQLRRLMAYMSDMVTHISTVDELCSLCTSHVVAKILDVECISLFIRPTLSHVVGKFTIVSQTRLQFVFLINDIDITEDRGYDGSISNHILYKYTSRSRKPEIIDMHENKSLAAQVLSIKKNARLNSLSRVSSYNPDIDSVPGVHAKRLISIPIRDLRNQKHHPIEATSTNMLTAIENAEAEEIEPIIFGTIHFINKSSVITESDEIILTSFVDFIASMLLNSKYIHDIFEKSQLLGHLLESATTVYDVIPDHHNIAFTPSRLRIQPKEILVVVERIFYNILKVSKVRALLVSDQINQDGDNILFESTSLQQHSHQFLYLDPYAYKTPKTQSLLSAELTSGIAGHVYHTKDFHIFDFNSPQSHDERLNPLVDLEPLLGGYLLCLPVISLTGNILAVIELIHGVNSPAIEANSSDNHANNSDQIDFVQASLWLVHQLTPPLEYLMTHVNKPIKRPAMSPGSIANSTMPSPRTHADSAHLHIPAATSSTSQPTGSATPTIALPSVTEFIRSPSFSAMKSTTLVSQRKGSKQILSGLSPMITTDNAALVRQPTTTADYQSQDSSHSPDTRRLNTTSSMLIETVVESSPMSLDDGKFEPTRLFDHDTALEKRRVSIEEHETLQAEHEKLRNENADLLLEIEKLKKIANQKRNSIDHHLTNPIEQETAILPSDPPPRIRRPVSSHR
jgi:hypothetical protein